MKKRRLAQRGFWAKKRGELRRERKQFQRAVLADTLEADSPKSCRMRIGLDWRGI